MTGILIPELIIYQAIENITKYIRDDLNAHSSEPEKTFLYRLLGLDDDGNPMKMNRYNYFVQAKKIFNNAQNLTVNFGYNFEVAKIISFHIILPSEQPSAIPIGEDEGYQTEQDGDGSTQLKFCQMFSSTYQVMITSDNSTEVNTVYHIYKSLFVALVPHFSLKGLMNPKFSGNDIVFQDDQTPMGSFHKVLNISFEYELVVPQLLLSPIINAFHFDSTPAALRLTPNGGIVVNDDDYGKDAGGKDISEYPRRSVEAGINRGEFTKRNFESGRQTIGEDKEFIPTHIINGIGGENNTLHDIRVVATDNGVVITDAAVELRSENYLYWAYTDENGIAHFPQIANETYKITVAKSGVNQGEFDNIRFDLPETYIQYSQVDKNIWDGMHADTSPILYVDIHDGGRASQI